MKQNLEPRVSVLDAIGNTPLVEVDGILAKLEYLNPSGSIKARIAKYMIERAEAEGLLGPGDVIVEASSGNTGNAMSLVAAAKGYRMRVITAGGLTDERLQISRALGAEVEIVGDFHLTEAIVRAKELGSQPGFYHPDQFDADWNVQENQEWLGREILDQLPSDLEIDAFVMGIGTGGTIIGVGRALRARFPGVRLVAVEPAESRTLLCGEVGRHEIEGIADGLVPGIVERYGDEIDEIRSVSSDDAIREMRRLAAGFGHFVGPSSGAHMVVAKALREEFGYRNILTVFVDRGEKYLSKHFA